MNERMLNRESLLHEVLQVQKDMLLYRESPIARILKEAQQANLLRKELLRTTISPLGDELAHHQKMIDEIRTIQNRKNDDS